jgi:hypothetical protein
MRKRCLLARHKRKPADLSVKTLKSQIEIPITSSSEVSTCKTNLTLADSHEATRCRSRRLRLPVLYNQPNSLGAQKE